jgi:hypothetical protein
MNKLFTTLLLVLFAIPSFNVIADEFDDEIYPYDTTYDLTAKDEFDDEIYPYDTTYDLTVKDEFDDEIYPYDTTYDLTAKGLIICISFNTVANVGKGAISKNQELAFKAALLRCAGPKGENLKSCKIPKCFWVTN